MRSLKFLLQFLELLRAEGCSVPPKFWLLWTVQASVIVIICDSHTYKTMFSDANKYFLITTLIKKIHLIQEEKLGIKNIIFKYKNSWIFLIQDEQTFQN